ncbi:hypothetical protein WA158_000322 [Blastocystis sp. Blastoise]
MSKANQNVMDINDLLGLNSKPKTPQTPPELPSNPSIKHNDTIYSLDKTFADYCNLTQGNDIVSDNLKSVISQYEKFGAVNFNDLFESHSISLTDYYNALTSALFNVKDAQFLDYILILLEDLLNYDQKRIYLVYSESHTDERLIEFYKNLLNHLSDRTQHTIYIPVETSVLTDYFDWLLEKLRMATITSDYLHTYITSFSLFLSVRKNRQGFNYSSILSLLPSYFPYHSANNVQIMYEIIVCLWCLSYSPESIQAFTEITAEEVKSQRGYLFFLCEMLKSYSNEKLIRSILLLFTNILNIPQVIDLLIEYKLLRILRVISGKKYKDTELNDLIQSIHDQVVSNYKQLTSFELYEQEVNSGILKWGPRHTSEFFKDEIRSFEKDQFYLIKKLIEIVSRTTSKVDGASSDIKAPFDEEERNRDRESIAVACYDLGEFACFYNNGKNIIKQWHGKEKMMALISHPDTVISKNALVACSKLMLNHWEYVNFEKKQ